MLCGDDFRSRYFNKWKFFYGFFFVCLYLVFVFFETGFLCVALVVLELTRLASASQVLGLKECTTGFYYGLRQN